MSPIDASVAASMSASSMPIDPTPSKSRSARLDTLPYDVIALLAKTVLNADDDGAVQLLHLALAAPVLFAPSIRAVIDNDGVVEAEFLTMDPTWPSRGEPAATDANIFNLIHGLDATPGVFVAYASRDLQIGRTKWRLVLPARTRDRRHITNLSADQEEFSGLWSTIPVPLDQLRYFEVDRNHDELLHTIPFPSECRHLTIDASSNDPLESWPFYPRALTSLYLRGFSAEMSLFRVLEDVPPALSTLLLNITYAEDDEVLPTLFEHFPLTLSTLTVQVWSEAMHGASLASMHALTAYLARMPGLQVLDLDGIIRYQDVAPVLHALVAANPNAVEGAKRIMRSLNLGVHILRDQFPALDHPKMTDDIGKQLQVDHMGLSVGGSHNAEVYEQWDDHFCHLLVRLPVATTSLRLQLPAWSNDPVELVDTVLDHIIAPTLTTLELSNSSLSIRTSSFPLLALDPTKLPHSLTSLTLAKCFTSRSLADLPEKVDWAFPPSVTRLSLAENALTTSDLAFLWSRLPPNLRHLDLSSNAFHTLPSPLPAKLCTLDVTRNAALSDHLGPHAWIDALPLTLLELDVSYCALRPHVGKQLVVARHRAGLTRAGCAKLYVEAAAKEERALANRFSSDLLAALADPLLGPTDWTH